MSTPEESFLEGLKPADLLQRGLESLKPPSGSPFGWQPPQPAELALLLPQYAIESLLGRGGMGAVYRGKQIALDRPIAIKLLPAELAQDAEFTGRFQREARTLARLQHPGIVSVYDFGQTSQGHLYFVMEYVDGTDLHRIIHGPGLQPLQVLEIVGQVCEALQYAHSHNVMHRDIKPANLLLTKDGRAKLADFGLARPMHEESGAFTRSNVVMGTPDYIAPEQLYGQADHRADLFSLGVMLYEMLTGQTPRGAWLPPSTKVQVDVRLDQVVIRALQQDAAMRYQQASEMKTDVDQIRFTPSTGTLHTQSHGPGHGPNLGPHAQTNSHSHAHSHQTHVHPPAQSVPLAAAATPLKSKPQAAAPHPRDPTTHSHTHGTAHHPPRQRRKKSGMGVFWAVALPAMLLAGGYGWLSRRHEAAANHKDSAPPPAHTTSGAADQAAKALPAAGLTGSASPSSPTAAPSASPSSANPSASGSPSADTNPTPGLAVPIPGWLQEARLRGGRLRLFGTWKGQALSLGKAVEFDDFVQVVTGVHGWAARRKNGETYATTWPNHQLVPIKTNDVRGGHMVSLLQQHNQGDLGYRVLWDQEILRRDEVTHPQTALCLHPYQLVLAISREGRILKTTEWGGGTKKGPPSDFFEGYSAIAATQDDCIVAKPGRPPESWNILRGQRYTFPAKFADVVALDATSQSVIMLTRSGTPAVFSIPTQGMPQEVAIPPDIAPAIAVKAGRTLYAAQRPDGTWHAWGLAPELIAKTHENGPMLDVDYDFQPNVSRVMLWIDAPGSPSSARVPKVPSSNRTSPSNTAAPTLATRPALPNATTTTSATTTAPPGTPAKPADEVSQRLNQLAAQFQTAYDRDIQADHTTAVADLDSKYTAAVQRALAAASSAGDLEEAMKLREEVQRIQDQRVLPSIDFDSLPASLKKLRSTYRESLTKLIVSRKTDAQPLYDRYDELLATYQTELTQQQRLDDAVRVKQAREELSRMRTLNAPPAITTPAATAIAAPASNSAKGTPLFDGKSLNGWRIEGDKNAFTIVGGMLKASELRGTLICTEGPWKDFELNLKVMTENRGNSGVWIHTPKNPPDGSKPGLEVQLCNDGADVQKTGSIYSIKPLTNQLVRDGQWFDLKIIVQNKSLRVFINGAQVNEWTQPSGWRPPPSVPTASLSSGTLGLQSNGGVVWFKEVYLNAL